MEDLSRQQDQKRSRVCSSSEEMRTCRKDNDMEQITSTAPSSEHVGTNTGQLAPSSKQVSPNAIQVVPSSEQVSTNTRVPG